MKDNYQPSSVRDGNLKIFRSVRKNCATLAGTATLAAFLAAAATPAQAARHHHHNDSSTQSRSHDADTASDSPSPHHHHHHHNVDTDDNVASTPVRHHHHHHVNSDDTVAATPEHHHHHHHSDSDDVAAATPTHHRHHHHEDSDDTVAATPVHHHHHHHDDSDDTVAAATPSHHHHHHHHDDSDATVASAAVSHHHHSSNAAVAAQPKQSMKQAWLAHVARYQAHMQNVFRRHEEREAMAIAHRDNVLAADQALESGSVVRAAEAFRGTPYVMGGTDRSGFDCSGFTRFILGRSAGVELPRTAEEQYYTGKPIEKSQLEAGDLVFFKDTYRHGISHVGMYIGDGRFVHACSPSEGVTVSSLNESYYENHWAGARRVINKRSESGDL